MCQERKSTRKIYQENLPKEPIHGIITNHNTTKPILQTVSTQACKHDIINKKSPAFFYLLLSLFTATLSLKLQANWFAAINHEGFQYILFIPENVMEEKWINNLENGENMFNSFNDNNKNLFIYKMVYPPYTPSATMVNHTTYSQTLYPPYAHQPQSNGEYPETVALCIDGSPCTLHKLYHCNNAFYIFIDKTINRNTYPFVRPCNYLMD